MYIWMYLSVGTLIYRMTNKAFRKHCSLLLLLDRQRRMNLLTVGSLLCGLQLLILCVFWEEESRGIVVVLQMIPLAAAVMLHTVVISDGRTEFTTQLVCTLSTGSDVDSLIQDCRKFLTPSDKGTFSGFQRKCCFKFLEPRFKYKTVKVKVSVKREQLELVTVWN